ncbi:hypothetical protein Tco_0535839 [Tanacetum coccineum]
MEMKDTLSSCSDLDEQEIQQLQKQAKILKENSLNKLNALKTTIQHLLSSNSSIARHEQELQNRLKRLNERKLQIQECKIQDVKASNACSGDTDSNGIVSDKGNYQGLENQSNTSGDESSRSRNELNDKSTSGDDTDIRPSYDTEPMVEGDSNVIPDSPDMCDNDIQTDQNAIEYEDERVALANLIANLKLDIDENKKIQKQLKKANASLTQELTKCKSTLAETSRTLGESNSIRDSCLIALQNKQTEFERYKAFNDRIVDYDKLECKLNETLGLLAQKDIDIKEGLKLKAYEISVVKEKHDELVKQSLLTKSHCECLVKEKTQIPHDQSDPANRSSRLGKMKLTLERGVVKLEERLRENPMITQKLNNLKAQLKDKNIAISELKKLIEKMKGKSMDTNFEKQSILGKPPLQPRNQLVIPIGQRSSPNKSSNAYLKTTPLRSGLTWKPTGKIFTHIGLKWIPIKNPVETRYNMNDSASPLGKETHNPKTVIWQTLHL